jgi:NIPSNAP
MREKRMTKRLTVIALGAAVFVGGFVAGTVVRAQSGDKRVFELRTYTAPEGKLGDLHKRFRDHTMRIFKKHGMESLGYWQPQDAPDSQNTLIYIVSHQNREAAKKNWADFQADPEWQKVSAESQVNGRIVSKVVSVFMDATDYSPMK